MNQWQTSAEAQGKQSVSHAHVDVKNIVEAGTGDDHNIGVTGIISSVFATVKRFAVKQNKSVI